MTRTKLECVFDLLKLGVVFTGIFVAVFCLCILVLAALRGALGVANPSWFNLTADLVRRVGVHSKLDLGVCICSRFSLPILGVR